jgi:mono/diheme cytochrome c family protein
MAQLFRPSMSRLGRAGTGLAVLGLLAVTGATGRRGEAGDDRGRFVEVWTRGESAPSDAPSDHPRSRRVDLDRAASRVVERYDAQYDRVARYRGVPLGELLAGSTSDERLDLAILHFANGMAIPVPLRDRTTMARLDPFVARAWSPDRRQPLGRAFPPIRRDGAVADPRPTEFSGNKIVVAERWHPALARQTEAMFSPWTRADTLVGVELVASAPYYAQFDVGGEPPVQRGLALYRGSCQFCHGARHVGAAFGWDFVDSPTIYDAQSSAENLYQSIAYRPRNATELGLLMPALGALTEEDASNLQRWLQAIATRPMPAYAPPPSRQRRR